MTPLQRALLIILSSLICFCVFFIQKLQHKNKAKRTETFLMSLSLLFPVIDLNMQIMEVPIKAYDLIVFSYLLFNIHVLKQLKKFILLKCLLIVLLVSSLCSDFVSISILGVVKYFSYFVIFLAAIDLYIRRGNDYMVGYISKLLKYPIFYTITWGVIQIILNPYFSLYYSVWDKELRLSSCYLDPQIAACAIAVFTIYQWNSFYVYKKKMHLYMSIILFVLGCYTGSKGFFLGFSCGMVFTFFRNFNIKSIFYIILICISVYIFYKQLTSLPVFARLMDVEESLEGRQNIYWVVAYSIFLENWILGIGPGAFRNYVEYNDLPLQHRIGNGEYIYASQPESGYLLWLDEIGVFSILWVFAIYLLFIKYSGNRVYNKSLITPWCICFVSVYNLSSAHIVYILLIIIATIICNTNKSEI